MNDENPYAVSQACSGAVRALTETVSVRSFRVTGNMIVCGKSILLPEICAFTGATDQLTAVSQHAQFPSFKLVVVQRSCHVTYFVTHRAWRRRKLRNAVSGMVALLGLLSVVAAFLIKPPVAGIVGVTGILTFFGAIAVIGRGFLPLRLSRFDAPDTYWLRGFPQEYLNRIATQS